ncbi:arylamine N-acetyltransferase [Bacillus salitolerans]|uniref:Arylamine N-acetyltransferase n=1 Tax=Bacillus salitolerans TaxID=1437434 RepID=A0ABW4LS45_9BACI
MDWKRKYLSFLEVEEKAPTYGYLVELIQAHMQKVSFDLCSKIHYFLHQEENGWLTPPIEVFVQNLYEKGFGGNCFILNPSFKQLVEALGYSVHLVRIPAGHVAMCVTIENKQYYVDVGYSVPIFEPVKLGKNSSYHACGEDVYITKESENSYIIDRHRNGASFVKKTIDLTPIEMDDLASDIADSYKDVNDNRFMRRVTATVFKEGIAYSVANNILYVASNKESKEYVFERREDWMKMMKETYSIKEKYINDALAFLEDRGVHLFKQSCKNFG